MEKQKTILVVDDSVPSLKLCQGLLRDDYDIRLAKSGKMALAALGNICPDVILLDIEMPDMTGFEVIEEIKNQNLFEDIPVIFVTSHATERLVARAVEHGAKGYIVKPFDARILRTKIEQALKKEQR